MTLPVGEAPKIWYDTKRGVGMAMVGLGTLVPVLAAWFGVTVDPAVVGELGAEMAKWFDITWNVVGTVIWVVGSIWPTAPLKFVK
jgi:hypothetical protein